MIKKYFAKLIDGEMHVCIRELKVGDIGLHRRSSREMGEISFIDEKSQTVVIKVGDGSIGRGIPMHLQLVFPARPEAIGPISKEATWIKEFDQFDQEEIRVMKTADSIDSKIIREMLGEKWEHAADEIITPGKVHHIKVKGPCGHFH